MNLEYKSGRRLMDARFIESNLGGINIISEIFDSVLLWNWVKVHLIGWTLCCPCRSQSII